MSPLTSTKGLRAALYCGGAVATGAAIVAWQSRLAAQTRD
jgi:hypothetical protein